MGCANILSVSEGKMKPSRTATHDPGVCRYPRNLARLFHRGSLVVEGWLRGTCLVARLISMVFGGADMSGLPWYFLEASLVQARIIAVSSRPTLSCQRADAPILVCFCFHSEP